MPQSGIWGRTFTLGFSHVSTVSSTHIKGVSFRAPNDTDWGCQLPASLETYVPLVKKSFMNRPDTSDQIWSIKDPLDVKTDKNHSVSLNEKVSQSHGGGAN